MHRGAPPTRGRRAPAHDFIRRRHLSERPPHRQTRFDPRVIGRRVDYASRPASRGRACIAARRSGVFSWGLMDLFECRAPMDLDLPTTKSFGSKSTKPSRIQSDTAGTAQPSCPRRPGRTCTHTHTPHTTPRVSPAHRRAPPRAARRANPYRVPQLVPHLCPLRRVTAEADAPRTRRRHPWDTRGCGTSPPPTPRTHTHSGGGLRRARRRAMSLKGLSARTCPPYCGGRHVATRAA